MKLTIDARIFAVNSSCFISSISGVSQRPGLLSVGVLLPQKGTWRLFLQCKIDGTVVTVPYTLKVV